MSAVSTVALEELMAAKSGSVDPSKYRNEMFDLYSIPSFDRGKPDVVAGSEIGSAKQVVEPGDVLLSRIVPHIRRAWVVGDCRGRRIIASGEWITFRHDHVEPRYLRHVLVGDPFHAEFMRTVSGVGGSLLRARPAYVAKIQVPLPPLPEQRRIADVLDRAEGLRAKRRASLAQLDTLTQAVFIAMFGDPATNPKEWPQVALGQHASKIGSGATPVGGEEAYKASGITLIRSMNVRDGVFSRGGLAFIDEHQAARLDGVVVAADDILLNITGASVARVCRAPQDALPARVNQHVAIIRPTATFHPRFLEACLLCLPVKRRLLKLAGAGATREAITKAEIEMFTVIRPPRDIQDRFANAAGAFGVLRRTYIDSLDDLNALFASLQHRAFRGEL